MAYTVKDLKEDLANLPDNWEIRIDKDMGLLYAEEPVPPHRQQDIIEL